MTRSTFLTPGAETRIAGHKYLCHPSVPDEVDRTGTGLFGGSHQADRAPKLNLDEACTGRRAIVVSQARAGVKAFVVRGAGAMQ